MPDHSSHDPKPETTSLDYQRGYRDAKDDTRRDLANILRIHSEGKQDGDDETLSDAQVREIFAGVFGAMATDQEFGEPPEEGYDTDGLRRCYGPGDVTPQLL